MLSPTTTDHLMRLLLWTVALLIAIIPILLLSELITTGITHITPEFIFSNPEDSGRRGGIASLILSTSLVLLVCLAVVIPLGLASALFLNEMVDQKSKLKKVLSQGLDILAGVPSIVYGLFGYVFFAQVLGLGFSILSGGLSLACMVLPLFVRMAELALKNSPHSYRQAAEALNLSHLGFITRVLLPSVAPGLAAATIIAMGRALAESAVLIFTAGYVTRTPTSLLDSGRTLSVHIYDLAMNVAGGTKPAAATALVLIATLIIINSAARHLGKRWITR